MLLTSKKSSLGELAVIQNNLILRTLEGSILFFLFFSKMHHLGNKKNSSKRGRWHLVVMQIHKDLSISLFLQFSWARKTHCNQLLLPTWKARRHCCICAWFVCAPRRKLYFWRVLHSGQVCFFFNSKLVRFYWSSSTSPECWVLPDSFICRPGWKWNNCNLFHFVFISFYFFKQILFSLSFEDGFLFFFLKEVTSFFNFFFLKHYGNGNPNMKILAELLIYSHMKEISRSEMFFSDFFFLVWQLN